MKPGLLREIEGHPFSARVNVASGFPIFIQGLLLEDSVTELISESADREVALRVLRRVVSLSLMATDPQYENPFDASLAAYLWVLFSRHRDLARIGAESILRSPNLWWSKRVRDLILGAQPNEERATATQQSEIRTGRAREANVSTADSTSQLWTNWLGALIESSALIHSLHSSASLSASVSGKQIHPPAANVWTRDSPSIEFRLW